jgi:cytochrome c oxidase subunit 2
MAFRVRAEPRRSFERWLAANRRPARAPTGALARQGRRYFMEDGCAACHTIAGTPARGTVGPSLTHLASRTTLAALTIPNDRRELGRWIRNPQEVKPGTKMPGLGLSNAQFRAIAAYLSELR